MNLKQSISSVVDNDTEITLATLEAKLYTMSVESIALDGSSGMASKWLDSLRGFLKDSHTYLSRKLDIIMAKPTVVRDDKLLRAIRGQNYLSISPVVIPAIAGFQVTALEYATILDEAASVTGAIEKDLIQHVSNVVGRFINQPEELSNASSNEIIDYKSTSVDLRQRMVDVVGGDTTRISQPFGDLYERLSDIGVVTSTINTANAKHHTTKTKDMVKLVSDLSKRVEQLMRVINKHTSDGKSVGPNMAGMLSNVIYLAAREVEFYSIVGFNLETFSNVTQKGYDELVRMLEK